MATGWLIALIVVLIIVVVAVSVGLHNYRTNKVRAISEQEWKDLEENKLYVPDDSILDEVNRRLNEDDEIVETTEDVDLIDDMRQEILDSGVDASQYYDLS